MDGAVGPGAPATAPGARRDVQLAVRACLRRLAGPSDPDPPACVVVGVSGGPDSLALLAATVHVAVPTGLRVHAVTVDHGWRHGSAVVAARAAAGALALGADDARVVRVVPARSGSGGWVGGPEDAARTARLAALSGAASRDGAVAVLLGHTLDDQAEQVLLGLARGSGSRALAGMPALRPPFARPLLGLRRDVVAAACPQPPGLPWVDPANTDPAYLRSRVRHDLVPVLVDVLGPAALTSLARSADLLRRDDDALAGWAARETEALLVEAADPVVGGAGAVVVDVPLPRLAALPDAVRTRVLRLLARAAGCGALTLRHTEALDDLLRGRSERGAVSLPGSVVARRRSGPDGCGRLRLAAERTPREDPHGRR